jgi:hypothetical protein
MWGTRYKIDAAWTISVSTRASRERPNQDGIPSAGSSTRYGLKGRYILVTKAKSYSTSPEMVEPLGQEQNQRDTPDLALDPNPMPISRLIV